MTQNFTRSALLAAVAAAGTLLYAQETSVPDLAATTEAPAAMISNAAAAGEIQPAFQISETSRSRMPTSPSAMTKWTT